MYFIDDDDDDISINDKICMYLSMMKLQWG